MKKATTTLAQGLSERDFREAMDVLLDEQQRETAISDAHPYTWTMFKEEAQRLGIRDEIIDATQLSRIVRYTEDEFRGALKWAAAEQERRPYTKEHFVATAVELGIPSEKAAHLLLEKVGPDRLVRTRRRRLRVSEVVREGGKAGAATFFLVVLVGFALPLLMILPMLFLGPERMTNVMLLVTKAGGLADHLRLIGLVGLLPSFVAWGIGSCFEAEGEG
jgi:hypothetical protein